MLMDFGGCVQLGFPDAQLNDSLLSFLKGIYLHEYLAVNFLYHFLLALGGITMDGN